MSGHDSKYFSTTKRGEIREWKEELQSTDKDQKKDAVKKVIAAMTQGKDVSVLFTDVVNCMQTNDMELKKLVYLYLMNYAKSHPDLAILAVNTFVKDSQDPNPLVRALAVRTMGCIRVDKITEYLGEPLRKCLKDSDPYVRKTAAVCVAKLYDINPEMVEDFGFLENLQDMLGDANPMVVANAVASLSEIAETSTSNPFQLTVNILNKLLAALNECTEWGQVFILDSLARYKPGDSREAEGIAERIAPRLQHANSAVVLSAVKVLMMYMDYITNPDIVRSLCKKMAPPLVTLLSAEPEIQYVALRNIELIVQKRANILSHEIKVFFCKYNDPIYVKMEKLEIMIMLATEKNIEQVLLEFKEYATEVDVDFVRKSVRAIGRCAVKLERAAQRCVNTLLELIQTKVNYVVQEAIIVIRDIFRRYPNRYESIIATLCENLDTLDDAEAKASMIWIIGEYAERIDNADELLDSFLETYSDESADVQLQLLTATVKLFLKRPSDTQDMVQSVLKMATQDTDNPDLRDRGYVYWRLLSTDPEAAKAVVLAEKPLISSTAHDLEPSLLDTLTAQISTLSSVYHRPPEAFVSKISREVPKAGEYEGDEEEEEEVSTPTPATTTTTPAVREPTPEPPKEPGPATASAVGDLLDLGMGTAEPVPAPVAEAPAPKPAKKKAQVLGPAQGKGVAVYAMFERKDGNVVLDVTFENQKASPLTQFAVLFNKNIVGLAPADTIAVSPTPVMTGGVGEASLKCKFGGPEGPLPAGSKHIPIQVAVKMDVGVIYFQVLLSLDLILSEDGLIDRREFMAQWKGVPDDKEMLTQLEAMQAYEPEQIKGILEAHNVFFIAARTVGEGQTVMYYSAKADTGAVILLEITTQTNAPTAQVAIRTVTEGISDLIHQALQALFQ